MSLWLALAWFSCALAGFAVFIVCRKRLADTARDVAEEIDHRVRRALDAERVAEERLRQAFLTFQNPAEAVHQFQRARATVKGVPRADPPWGWTHADLEFACKQMVAEETAHRSRAPVVVAIVVVLILTIATATATVVLSNAAQPAQASPNSVGAGFALPASVAPLGLPLPLTPAPPDNTLPLAPPLAPNNPSGTTAASPPDRCPIPENMKTIFRIRLSTTGWSSWTICPMPKGISAAALRAPSMSPRNSRAGDATAWSISSYSITRARSAPFKSPAVVRMEE